MRLHRLDRRTPLASRDLWLMPRPRPTQPTGRVCAHDGCGTQLSVYNDGTCCDLHRHDAEHQAGDGTRMCARCHAVHPFDAEHFGSSHRRNPDRIVVGRTCRTCLRHMKQAARLTFLRRKDEAADGMRTCTGCGQRLPADAEHFYVTQYRSGRMGLRAECKPCCVSRAMENRRAVAP